MFELFNKKMLLLAINIFLRVKKIFSSFGNSKHKHNLLKKTVCQFLKRDFYCDKKLSYFAKKQQKTSDTHFSLWEAFLCIAIFNNQPVNNFFLTNI